MQANRAAAFIPQLTGIRCLAASMVLALHADQAVGHVDLAFVSRGYLGVDLFFLLSGFIIAHVYAESFREPSGRRFGQFMWHRFARLYPAHVTVLLFLLAAFVAATHLNVPLDDADAWTAKNFVKQVFLVHAWGIDRHIGWNAVSWSVSAEWFAYLLFPAIAFVILRLERPAAAGVAVLALLIMFSAFAAFDWDVGLWNGPPALTRVTGEFICGVALWRCAPMFKFSPAVFDILGAVAVTGFAAGSVFGLSDFGLIALLALLVFAAARSTGALAQVLSIKPAVWLGQISYSLYLVHFTTVRLLHKILAHVLVDYSDATKIAMFLLAFPCSVVAAAALYYLVERPARARLVKAETALPFIGAPQQIAVRDEKLRA
ncbi:MAG TPA: acyltransferase [Xanthobacteraceae bacterium]|nr:acyltransferase [Xanthobacteraceae bacterium]